jgi:thiamine-phosphate pyrophosphorylase
VTARVVAITDRRLCPVDEIAPRVAAVPTGSLDVQVREKDLDGGPLLALVRAIVATGAATWVNDRVDVALAAEARGVHLPENGLAVEQVLRVVAAVGRNLAIGRSLHVAREVATTSSDVVHLGSIWATPSKAGLFEPIGVDALRAARRLIPGRPTRLVAVGGIDSPERAREAAGAGADAVAVIRAIWTASDPARAVARLCEAVDEGIARRAAALTPT